MSVSYIEVKYNKADQKGYSKAVERVLAIAESDRKSGCKVKIGHVGGGFFNGAITVSEWGTKNYIYAKAV